MENEIGDTQSAEPSDLGKKVFFLYPPSVVKTELVTRLLDQEFEVYMLKDHESARKLLRAYPDSIIFVNIDEGMAENEWRSWIRAVIEDPLTKNVGVGILSYNTNEELSRFYLMELGARCGFVRLKLGLEESARILIGTLQANEAKGRRRYIRANCALDQLSSVNIRIAGASVEGTIRDISVVGFSCSLQPDPNFQKNALVEDIQLKLRGVLLKVEGIVFGSRQDSGQTVYVILFSHKLDGVSRAKIRRYIQTALQSEIEVKAKTA